MEKRGQQLNCDAVCNPQTAGAVLRFPKHHFFQWEFLGKHKQYLLVDLQSTWDS